jgi:hypothetical protein
MTAQTVDNSSRPAGMGKSIGAVVAGFVVNFVAVPIDQVLHSTGIYPPTWTERMDDNLFFLAISYRIVLGILGGYATARFAPRNPMKYALILGWIGFFLSLAAAIGTRNMNLGPAWYTYGLAILSIPLSWLGARLYLRRSVVR